MEADTLLLWVRQIKGCAGANVIHVPRHRTTHSIRSVVFPRHTRLPKGFEVSCQLFRRAANDLPKGLRCTSLHSTASVDAASKCVFKRTSDTLGGRQRVLCSISSSILPSLLSVGLSPTRTPFLSPRFAVSGFSVYLALLGISGAPAPLIVSVFFAGSFCRRSLRGTYAALSAMRAESFGAIGVYPDGKAVKGLIGATAAAGFSLNRKGIHGIPVYTLVT